MSIDSEDQYSNKSFSRNDSILKKYSFHVTYSIIDQATVERAVKKLRKKYPDRDLSLAEIKQAIYEEYDKTLRAKTCKENNNGFEIGD